MIRLVVLTLALVGLLTLPARGYESPERGSPDRSEILDAARPIAEWSLGAPVEFVVKDIRVADGVAFLAVTAQRPGGGAIDLVNAPIVTRDQADPALVDGARLEILFRKSGNQWVPVQHAVGSTDLWYAWDAYCPIWASVLPKICKH